MEGVNPVRNSSRRDSKPSGVSKPAGIILGPNPAAEQRGIISNGVKIDGETGGREIGKEADSGILEQWNNGGQPNSFLYGK